jgi:hypothetical protein
MEERYYDSSSEQITAEEIQEDEAHSVLNDKKQWFGCKADQYARIKN